MTFAEFKNCAAAAANALGIADYELYYSASESTSVGIFQHEVNSFESSVGGGVSFRCLRGGRMGYASTEDLSESEAERIVRAAWDNAGVLEAEEQEFLGEGGKEYRVPEVKAISLPSTEELVKKALEAQDALYAADELVIDGSETQLVSFCNTVAIVNSRGLDLSHESKNNILFSSAVVSDGKEIRQGDEQRL